MTTTSHDIVIKSVTEFYRKEEINAAKMMLFAECDTTIRKKLTTLMLLVWTARTSLMCSMRQD